MSIVVTNVSKQFGNFTALKDINLEVPNGKLVALLGPSGSGKSTLLRAIAGLEEPDQGQIVINGEDATHVDIRKRNIGFVFQHYALFKHLTIRQNIAFGLEIRKHPKAQTKERVEELLQLIQLEGLGNRYPSQLSGGQRQRVALARALAVQPKVLLLDEPFGALDAKVRKELRSWLRKLHDEVHLTSVFVTHDQEEAMEVADEIVVMSNGNIEQVGTAQEIYDHPATPFVMGFIGEVNVLPHTLPVFDQGIPAIAHSNGHSSTPPVFVRPHDFDIHLTEDRDTTQASVKRITHLGREIQMELIIGNNDSVFIQLSREQYEQFKPQISQTLFIKPRRTKIFTGKMVSEASRLINGAGI